MAGRFPAALETHPPAGEPWPALPHEVASHILHLAERRLTLYTGDYDRFLRTRQAALAHQQALAARQAAERKRLRAFIDRFRAKASKARQAQSRIKLLARFEPVSIASDEPPAAFDFPDPPAVAPPLLTLDGVVVGYAPAQRVLRRLDLRVDPDDRIALLGANGNGKSTLARLLAGRLAPVAGRMRRAPKLGCGFFAQHQIEELDPAATPYQHLSRLLPQATPEELRARLARFGFGADKVFVAPRSLSGGEKARLNFALISAAAPSLLILDEPTNHLDIQAREALVEAIAEFAGAVILISHDWHLLSLTADRLWLVAEGTAGPFDGDLDDYRRLLLAERAPSASEREGAAPAPSRRDARREAAERRASRAPLHRRLWEAEQRLVDLAGRKAALEQRLVDPATYANSQSPEAPLRERAALARALAEAEAHWLTAAEAMEANDC